MVNKIVLTGRLTASPEIKKTNSDVSVTSFSLAVQRSYKGSDGSYPVDFINIVAWRNTAEFICKFFGKGQMIALVGSLQTRSYEDKNGDRRVIFEVIAEEAHFCGDREKIAPEFKAPAIDADGDELPF